MDKVGIPRNIFYYYDKDIVEKFLSELKIPYVISPHTNKKILEDGLKIASDEMCLSFKIYLGHINYLKDKCDYIFVPRMCNLGSENQMCTNFMSAYDIVNNLFDKKILNYDIDYEDKHFLKKGLYKIGTDLNCPKNKIRKAYKIALKNHNDNKKREISINEGNLKSKKIKILIVGHPYNIYDDFVGMDIIKYLKQNDVEVIYSDRFDSEITNKLSKKISKELYFKFSKENIGSIIYSQDKIDGVIFLSSFPCAPDSLVTEITERSIDIPNINLIIDDNASFAGLETRLESFLDVLKERKND